MPLLLFLVKKLNNSNCEHGPSDEVTACVFAGHRSLFGHTHQLLTIKIQEHTVFLVRISINQSEGTAVWMHQCRPIIPFGAHIKIGTM